MRGAGVDGPSGHPARDPAGGVGDDDHAGETFTPLGEQTRAGQTLGAETCGLQVGPQTRSRRVAEPETGGRAGADAPCGKIPLGLRAAPELPCVEPCRDRERRGIACEPGCYGRPPLEGLIRLEAESATGLQPANRPGQADTLHPLDEVEHVPAGAAAEAPEPLGI